ncbi:MAG: hypothetical protein M1828_003254 [Chrysothrix sp. TS-e1954]|nr:MAG: hypothetical protein M1828_003254 [Chrysothrix sp. TS-e1954]
MSTITLYRDHPRANQHSWSAFVCKLEARLRFSNVTYTAKGGSLSESPKGKVPYVRIEDSKGGEPELVSDSTLITRRLVEMGEMEDLNGGLSAEQKARDLVVRALCEDRLYWLIARERWTQNFYTMRDVGPLSSIPYPVRILIGYLAYSKVTKTLHGQGVARFSDDEYMGMYRETWEALEALVAASGREERKRQDSKEEEGSQGEIGWVLGGHHPTDADASLFGFLAGVMTSEANPKSQAMVQGLPALSAYASSIHDKYFPDYEKWT